MGLACVTSEILEANGMNSLAELYRQKEQEEADAARAAKLIAKIKTVHVPSAYDMGSKDVLALADAYKGLPCTLAGAAFKYGFLKGTRAAKNGKT